MSGVSSQTRCEQEGQHLLKFAPLVNVYRSLGFMLCTMGISQLCSRSRRRLQPRHVPLVITSAVVLCRPERLRRRPRRASLFTPRPVSRCCRASPSSSSTGASRSSSCGWTAASRSREARRPEGSEKAQGGSSSRVGEPLGGEADFSFDGPAGEGGGAGEGGELAGGGQADLGGGEADLLEQAGGDGRLGDGAEGGAEEEYDEFADEL